MKRWIALGLALGLACATAVAQAKTLQDYRIPQVEDYCRLSLLAGGDRMLASSGLEEELRLSRRAEDGSVRYEVVVPMMSTQRGTLSASLPDGRYAAAFRVDEETDEVRLYDESGEVGTFRLPLGADYLRMEETCIVLVYRDLREVKLIDYTGREMLTLSLPVGRKPRYAEAFIGQQVIYVLASTQALDGENATDAPYLLCAYDTEGGLLFDRLLFEGELGFYLYGSKCVDAQDALVIAGADQTDYKRAHVLRVDTSGRTTYHHVISDDQGAVVSISCARADGEDTTLYGTVMAQSRGVFACVELHLDNTGVLTESDLREFDLTRDYLYDLGVAPDGTAYAVKRQIKDKGIEFEWISVVPFADLPATDKARVVIE